MLLYRLAIKRLIEYFKLDQVFKADESLLILLHKKKKVISKLVLKTDQTLNFYISLLLSVITPLICLSIPFASLTSPCAIFVENELKYLNGACQKISEYSVVLDGLISFLIIILVVVSTNTVADAIENTDIDISPWVARGKYRKPELDADNSQDEEDNFDDIRTQPLHGS